MSKAKGLNDVHNNLLDYRLSLAFYSLNELLFQYLRLDFHFTDIVSNTLGSNHFYLRMLVPSSLGNVAIWEETMSSTCFLP